MRPSSSPNLCSGSWECSYCHFINEPIVLEPTENCQVCKVCNLPNKEVDPPSHGNDVLLKKESRRSVYASSKDNIHVKNVSWSELGEALETAAWESHRHTTSSSVDLRQSANFNALDYENVIGRELEHVDAVSSIGPVSCSEVDSKDPASGKKSKTKKKKKSPKTNKFKSAVHLIRATKRSGQTQAARSA